MANGKDDLVIRIGANSKKFAEELEKVKSKTKNLEEQLATLGKVSGAVFIGVSGAIGKSVADFSKFDNEIRGVKTLLNSTSFGAKSLEEGFADMRGELLDVAKTIPVSIGSMNKSLFDTVSAGVDAAQAVDVVATASRLAVAGLTDVSVATDGITSALNAYGLEASEAESVAAKFFQAQVAGKTTIEELSSFFGRAGATAAAYGVNLDELLSSVSAVTAGGVQTAAAFTGLNALMVNISKPTKEAKDEAKRLGIEFNSTALRAQGLSGFLNTLSQANGFTKESIEKLFGSVEAQKIAFALTGEQAELFGDTLSKLGDETGSAQKFSEAYEVQSKSLENVLKKLNNGVKVFSITIGSKLAPTISDIADGLQSAADAANELDEEQVESLASFAKWTAIVTGGIAAATAFGLAAIKISAIIGGLTAAFAPAAVGASAFWIAVTGPIGIAVAGIAAVAAGAFALFKIFNKEKKPETLMETTNELKKINSEIDEIEGKKFGASSSEILRLNDLKKQREELQKLREEKIKASEDFGTGELLFKAKLDKSFDPLADFDKEVLNQGKEIKIPMKPVVDEAATQKALAGQDKITQKVDEKTQARIDALEREALVQEATLAGFEKKDIEFLERALEIEAQYAEAKKIKNEEERALRLENIRAENEILIQEQEEFAAKQLEQEAMQNENMALFKEELAQLEKEKRMTLNQEELASIAAQIKTKEELEKQYQKKRLLEAAKANQKFLEDERKFGVVYATINKIMHSEVAKGTMKGFNELQQLHQSSNNTLKSIGEVAAIAQIVQKTAVSAMNIYNGWSSIPFVGHALGIAGALAAVAFGGEQIRKVRGAKNGALVTTGQSGKDTEPFMLAKNEIVAPEKSFDEVVEGTARQRGFVKQGESGGMTDGLLKELIAAVRGLEVEGITVQGDILADEVYIDRLAEKLREAQEFRNVSLV